MNSQMTSRIRLIFTRLIFTKLIFTLALFLALAAPSEGQNRGFSDDYSGESYGRARVCDIIHIKLEPVIDIKGGRIDGVVTTTLSPIYEHLSEVYFDAVDMQIQSVALSSGTELDYRYADNRLTVLLDRTYHTTDTLEIVVAYRAHPRMGLYFIGPDEGYPDKPWQVWSQGEMDESSYWFPCWDYPNDRATSEIIVTAPKGMMAIANGALISAESDPQSGETTYHWREDVPHVSYLISLIIGEFHQTSDSWDGIPINYYVYPPDKKYVELAFGKTPDMMRFFSEKIGVRYPYEKYAQTCVHDFIWGGMENISATTMTRRILHDERAEVDYQADGLVAHELAHQWWGDLLTTKNWNNIWLNEGFATYFDLLYTEHAKGHDQFQMRLRTLRESYQNEDSSKYRRPVVSARYEDPSQMFDRHTYRKGALVLHMLRSTLGDELWWKGINLYATRHREGTVETADFRQALEDASGRTLNVFFQQWIFRGGYPEFVVDWEWDTSQKMVKLNVAQTQEIDSVTPLFTMDVQILLTGDFGEKSMTVDVSNLEQTIYIPVSSRPERVEFDPEDIILKSLTFEKPPAELIGQLSSAHTLPGRIRAAEWLADSPQTANVVAALARALSSDTAWGVRQACAKSLGENKSENSRKALIAALSDTRSEVRRAAAKALGNHTDQPSATNALQRVFTTDLSYLTQGQALKSLAKLRAPKAYRYCMDALKKNSYYEWIRKAAFEALVELEDKRGIDQAFKWSAYGRPKYARTAAIKALGKLAEFDKKRSDEIRKRLEKFLDDKAPRIRGAAISALKELGDSKSAPALRRFMKRQIRFGPMKAARDAIAEIQRKAAAGDQAASVRKELADLKRQNKDLQSEIEDIKRLLVED